MMIAGKDQVLGNKKDDSFSKQSKTDPELGTNSVFEGDSRPD